MQSLLILFSILCAELIFHNVMISKGVVLLLGGAFLLLFYLFPDRRKYFLVAIFFFLLMWIRLQQVENHYLHHYDQKIVVIEGTIIDVIHKEDTTDYTLKVDRINEKKEHFKLSIRNKNNFKYDIGDRLRIVSRFQIPRANGNPYMLNYKNYLAKSNIFAEITPQNAGQNIGNDPSLHLKIRKMVTNYIDKQCTQYFKQEDANLLKTIFLGDKFMEEEKLLQIRRLGISHIIAISGFHIGLIYAILDFFFNILNIHKKWARFIILVLIWFYTYAIGMPASCFRAALMVTLISCCKNFDLPWNSKNVLLLSACIILFYRPYEIYNIGFQLSFLATFGLFLIQKKETPSLKGILRTVLYIYFILLPFTISAFNEISFTFLIGNLLIVPLFSIVISGGVLFLLFPFKGCTSWLLGFLLNALDLLLIGSERLFSGSFFLPSWNIFFVILYYSIFVLLTHTRCLKWISWESKKCVFRLISFYSILAIIFYLYANPVEIQFVDVGQGDSILVRTNFHTFLFDTGGSRMPTKAQENYVLYLKKLGISKIEAIFLTHFDEDHAANLSYLEKEYPTFTTVSRVGGQSILKEKYALQTPYIEVKHGDTIDLSPVHIRVFHYPTQGENNNSVVYRLTVHDISFLITGDIENKTEEKLSKEKISSDVLKVPHHGSNTGTSESLLKAVDSTCSIISCGYHNSYGHPHKSVLNRLEHYQQNIYRTDLDGNIRFYADRFGYQIYPTIGKIHLSRYLAEIIYAIFTVILIYGIIDEERKRIKNW